MARQSVNLEFTNFRTSLHEPKEDRKVLDDSSRPTTSASKKRTVQALQRAKEPLNDKGNAERLKAAFGDDIIKLAAAWV